MMQNYFVAWFYAEKEGEESRSGSSSKGFQDRYWKCIYCLYRSALIKNSGGIEYLFFTNVEKLPIVENVNMEEFFEKNKIHIIQMEMTMAVPMDWCPLWRCTLYMFDILQYLNRYQDGNFLILDADCIINKSLKPVYDDINQFGFLGYEMAYTEDHDNNGLTMRQMKEIYAKFYPEDKIHGRLFYYGGEIWALNSTCIRQIVSNFQGLWEMNFALYRERAPYKLNTEEHIYSVLANHLHMVNDSAKFYIKRIWTSPVFDTVEYGDSDFTIYHLPAEKGSGFSALFDVLSDDTFIEDDFARAVDDCLQLDEGLTRKARLKKRWERHGFPESMLQCIQRMASSRKIAVWGTGDYSSAAEVLFEKAQIDEFCYLDNNTDRQGKVINGKNVFSPGVINKEYFILISVMHSVVPEIKEQLRKYGLIEKEDFISIM